MRWKLVRISALNEHRKQRFYFSLIYHLNLRSDFFNYNSSCQKHQLKRKVEGSNELTMFGFVLPLLLLLVA